VDLQFIEKPEHAADADLVILPGTKSTIADLQWLRARGFERLLQDRVQKGLPVLGVCGGYQMLGETIEDPDHIESKEISISGLGLLPVTTRFEKEKVTAQVEASVLDGSSLGEKGLRVKTYEIHMGRVIPKSSAQPLFQVGFRNGQLVTETEGVVKGSITGTLMHGLFESKEVRQALISHLGRRKGLTLSSDVYSKDAEYDRLAEMIQNYLDTRFLDRLVGL
jgi:adenosylcobyric acid synthase